MKPLDFFLKKLSSASLSGLEDALKKQMENDINKALPLFQQKLLKEKINEVISQEDLQIPSGDLELATLKALSTYATSYQEYGPVLAEWAESLLNTAWIEKRKLIFIARDGIAPYLAAKILQEKFPERFKEVPLSLVYLSRTLVYSSTGLLEKISSSQQMVKEYIEASSLSDPFLLRSYIQQETDLQSQDRCLFVDIGFAGSMNPILSDQLANLSLDLKFCFLISHTKAHKVRQEKHRAWGFLAHCEESPMEVIAKAGKNPAVHWLEDTHQSPLKSPQILIRTQQGLIAPGTVCKKQGKFEIKPLLNPLPQTCKEQPEEFLVKWFGLQASLDWVQTVSLSQEPPQAWKKISKTRKALFGAFLETLKNRKRFLLIQHH